MDPNSVFSLFDCFGSILYELLIAGLMDPVYQSDAYEALLEVVVNKGKGAFILGEQRERPNFEGNKYNIQRQGT